MFTVTDGDLTWRNRYQKNVAAIMLLRELRRNERDPRTLLRDEQLTLAHFSAFGESTLLQRVRDDRYALGLSEDVLRSLTHAALTAYYTPPSICAAIWAALTPRIAQDGPLRVLEPAFGSGMFIGTMPVELRQRAQITGVELDGLTAQVAGYLYPEVTLHTARYEETDLAAESFDLIISNVPFGAMPVADRLIPKRDTFLRSAIHNYFFAKSVRLLRPGGVLAFLTSYGSLDSSGANGASFRSWLASQGTLLAALRLPQGTFEENSGTSCGADLIVFKKAEEGETPNASQPWVTVSYASVPVVAHAQTAARGYTTASTLAPSEFRITDDGDGQLLMNTVFATFPAQVLGRAQIVTKDAHHFCYVAPDRPVAPLLAAALSAVLPPTMLTNPVPFTRQPVVTSVTLDRNNPRVAGMLHVHAAAMDVIQRERQHVDVDAARVALGAAYDDFVASYGFIRARANSSLLRTTSEIRFLHALERVRKSPRTGREVITKAPIFFGPTIKADRQVIEGAMSADDALVCCLDQLGTVDLDVLARFTGTTRGTMIASLRGRIFFDPDAQAWVTADAYLSGNVRIKLRSAVAAAATDDTLQYNVERLRAVQPVDLTADEHDGVVAHLGAPWVGAEVVRAFISSIIPRFWSTGTVLYEPIIAQWFVSCPYDVRQTLAATATWGTPDVNAIDIILDTLANKPTEVYVESEDDASVRVKSPERSLAAQEVQQRLREAFAAWVWTDPVRSAQLLEIYNEQFNCLRRRDFDGSHLSFPGLNTSVLRDADLDLHQKSAVWQIVCNPTTLVDLCVGAGKTYIGLAAVLTLKRLGIAKRPMIITENHLVEQWAISATRLFPAMKVLAISADDFSAARRQEFLSRLLVEDYDCAILAHSSFGLISAGKEAATFIKLEIDELDRVIDAIQEQAKADNKATTRLLKQMRKKADAFRVRLQEAVGYKKTDKGTITWDDLGIDCLFVDESHQFKNLYIPTGMGNVPGVPQADAQRAFDMRVKTRDIQQRGGRVVFATGTPLSNTIAEMYIVMLYLAEDLLRATGLRQFDAWAATYATTCPMLEITPDGGGYRIVNRLAAFTNLPELCQLWFQFTFTRTPEQLNLPRPQLVTGRPIPVITESSQFQGQIIQELVVRAQRMKIAKEWVMGAHGKFVMDNMLKVVSDGRKVALDPRLFDPTQPEDPAGKIASLVQLVAAVYQEYDDVHGTQIIFCEQGTPKAEDVAKA